MKHTVKYRPYSKVIAAKAPYQVNELIKEIQDTIYNVASKYLKAEGWDMSDVADYFVVDVQEVEPGVIRAEIRGELEYEQLSELCSQLDKVIAVKFDKDAYFEPVEPGIAEAFIRTGIQSCTQVTASDETYTVNASNNIKMREVYITHYGAFDNGHVLHDSKRMTEKEAQEAAKQASIKDPTDAYYVHYSDDIMNPTSGIVWVNGVPYDERDVRPYGDSIFIEEDAQPVDMNIYSATNIGNKYCTKFKIGQEVRFNHGGGQYSDEVATISGYDKDGFYKVTWEDGSTSEGLSDAQLVYEYEDDIEMSTEIKAYTFDETEDGWGTDVRGILDLPFARAEDLMYEVRNTVRGVNTDCETVEDLAEFIRQLASEFEEAADEIESL